jgi:hypothetical protein
MALKPKKEKIVKRVHNLADLTPGSFFFGDKIASFILESDPEHIWRVVEPTPKIMLKVMAWVQNADTFYKSQEWATIQLMLLSLKDICDLESNPLPLEVDLDGFADLIKFEFLTSDLILVNSVMEVFEVNVHFRQQ